MLRTIITSLFILSMFVSAAQDSAVLRMMLLYDKDEYATIIKEYAPQRKNLSARALYYLGISYQFTDKDSIAIAIFNESLAKDNKDAEVYHYKAASFIYLDKNDSARYSFDRAIQLNPNRASSYVGLGDSYFYEERYREAIPQYAKALAVDSQMTRAYWQTAISHLSEDNSREGLKWLYHFYKRSSPEDSVSYKNVRYNIALVELLLGNPATAIHFLEPYVKDYPDDYFGHSKLIQAYFGVSEYEKAKVIRNRLYEAHSKKLLPENMETMFCFDQFEWSGKKIQAYERFQSGKSSNIYYKHIYYVLKDDGDIDFSVQTEYSPYLVEQDNSGKSVYFLGMTRGNYHATYPVALPEQIDYAELKKMVINILEEKISPSSSSTRGSSK